jgi:hypothetical protein
MLLARANGEANPPEFISAWKAVRLLVLLVPSPAILLGLIVMHQKGVAPLIWGQNLAAWLIATAFCVLLPMKNLPRTLSLASGLVTMLLLFLVLVTTFCFSGLDGVHRWLVFGPIRFHAGELLMPVLLIALASVREQGITSAWLFTFLVGVLLVLQPDGAQATAFIIPAAVLLMGRARAQTVSGWVGLSALCALIVAAWIRRDPLGSVPHVEGIVGLAADLGLIWAIVAVACLTLLPIPFLMFYFRQRGHSARDAALALAIYFTLSLVACLTGTFPVPLMGYGISPFVGYYMSIAWLLVQYRWSNCAQPKMHKVLSHYQT